MFGQLPEVQIVFSWYLSTNPLSSVYFSPIGNLTFSHFGLAPPNSPAVRVLIGKLLCKTLSIAKFFDAQR
jgi:hypothetical protein